jgi:hypothetical protein
MMDRVATVKDNDRDKLRRKNLALLAVLLAVIALMYGIALARLKLLP